MSRAIEIGAVTACYGHEIIAAYTTVRIPDPEHRVSVEMDGECVVVTMRELFAVIRELLDKGKVGPEC